MKTLKLAAMLSLLVSPSLFAQCPAIGSYAVINANSGKGLDVAGFSKDNAGTVWQWDYVGGLNQQWSLAPVDNAVYLRIDPKTNVLSAYQCSAGKETVVWTAGSQTSGTTTTTTSPTTIPPSTASIPAQHVIAGCAIGANDSVFNTPIDTLPVIPGSDTWTTTGAQGGMMFETSWSVNVFDSSVPSAIVSFYYTRDYNNHPFQLLEGSDRNRETGSLTTDGNNDHHMVGINHQTCHIYETYGDWTPTTATSGFDYDSAGYAGPLADDWGGSTDAAGLPLTPLMTQASEVLSGEIKHAMRYSTCGACIERDHLWPAIGSTGWITDGTAAPMGARARLKSSFPASGVYNGYVNSGGSGYQVPPSLVFHGCTVSPKGGTTLYPGTTSVQWIQVTSPGSGCVNPTVDIVDSSGQGSGASAGLLYYSRYAQVILKAWQKYGIILADIGQTNRVTMDSDVNEHPELVAALNEIQGGGIGLDKFEFVDESSLKSSDTSNKIVSTNALAIPLAQASPVQIGTKYTTLTITAGTPYSLKTWVNGATDQTVTWTVASGPGTISGNTYNPPTAVSTPVPVVLNATAAADKNATTTVYAKVIPSGAIRIDIGSPDSYLDSKGNVWLADNLGLMTGGYADSDDDYPGGQWGSLVDYRLYATMRYTWGDDIQYGPFVVPNGTYKVSFGFAKQGCAQNAQYDPSATFDNGLTSGGTVGLDANGALTMYDIGASIAHACRTPSIGTVTATVTDNILRVAVRATGGNNTHQSPFLNTLAIEKQ